MIRKEAWSCYRTISGVRLYRELEEPKGPKGPKGYPSHQQRVASSRASRTTTKFWSCICRTSTEHGGKNLCTVLSSDGRTIATAGGIQVREALIHDGETGELRFRQSELFQEIYVLAFSVNGSKLATGILYDSLCSVLDMSTGAPRS